MGLFDERIAYKPLISRPKGSYVYIHYFEGKPVYVGSGAGARVFAARRCHYDWDSYRIVEDNMTTKEALEMEYELQEAIGSENLKNKMIGGKHSEETKAKQRSQTWFHTDEAKEKMKRPKSKQHKQALKNAWIKRKQNGII